MRRMRPLYLILCLLFFVIGLALVVLGFDLDAIDLWLDAQGSWLDAVGSLLFRLLCGLVVALCVFLVLGGVWQRLVAPRRHTGDAAAFVVEAAEGDVGEADGAARPPGWGCMLLAVIVGYFAWFGVVG